MDNDFNPVKITLDKLNEQFKKQMNELIEMHSKNTQEMLQTFAKRGVNIND